MLTTALPSPKSNFSSPYLFFGELKSGLFQLSSDLSRVLGVADEGPCRFDLVMRRLLADECDRVVLRECFEEFARERTKLDQCVRIRLQGRIVWCRIRARAFKSDAGENVLVSGTVDFFSFQRIITELLRFSDFGPDEVDLLSRFAAADARRTLCVIRLESEDWKSAAFQDISDQIVRSLRGTMPHAVTVEQLDANTILFSAPDASLEFRDRVERLVDTVLRENYAETNVKPVIFISEGSGDHNEGLSITKSCSNPSPS